MPGDTEKANPSLAELEEELFPLDAPEAALDAAQAQDDRDEVLANGGFLPGA